MSLVRPRASRIELLRRLTAAGAAALVMTLAVFAASPDLHHWVHGKSDCDHDDNCAVVLFAQGVTGGAGALMPAVISFRLLSETVAAPVGPRLLEPRFHLPPGCGPPGLS